MNGEQPPRRRSDAASRHVSARRFRYATAIDAEAAADGAERTEGAARLSAMTAADDEAAMRGEVLPLGNSVLEDIQGTFN